MEGRQDAGDGVREEVAALESPNVRNNADLCLQLRPKLNYKPLFGQYKPLETLRKVEWAFILTSTLGLSASLGFCIRELVILPKNADDYTFSIMVCFTTGSSRRRCVLFNRDYIAGRMVGARLLFQTRDGLPHQLQIGRGGQVELVFHLCLPHHLGLAAAGTTKASLTIFVLENGVAATPFEIIIVVGNAAVITLWIFAGYLTIYKESKVWLCAFVILWIPSVNYMVYKCVRLYKRAHIEEWTSLYQTTLAIVVASIANKLFLAVAMFVVVRNFGQGLKEAVEAVPTNHHPLIDEAEEDEEEPRRDTPAVCGGREPRLPCFHRSWSPEIRRLASTRETESPYP
ncbi:uncharacterized protein LOC144145611 isoform X3 [Haemaphysalis longicornis]